MQENTILNEEPIKKRAISVILREEMWELIDKAREKLELSRTSFIRTSTKRYCDELLEK